MNRLVWIALSLGIAAVSSAQAQEGVTATEIRLGQTAPLTGPFATLGTANRDGALLYLEHVNGQGGVHGRRIVLTTLDDGYDAARAAANATRLVREERTFALFSVNGTPTALKALEVAERDGVPFLFPFSGASVLRKANRLVFHVRASYAQEMERLVGQAAGNGAKRLAVAYLDNAFGQEGLVSAERALAEHGLKAVAKAPLDPAKPDLEGAAKLIAAAQPETILIAAAGASVPGFIDAYQKQGHFAQFFCLSVVNNEQLIKVLGERAHGVVVAQVVPFPWDKRETLTREYHTLLAAKGGTPSFPHLEGYVSAKVLVEGLRRAGPKLTRAALIAALEEVRNLDIGGVVVTFSRQDHTNATALVDLTIVSRSGRFVR